MSMYNMIFGMNPDTDNILQLLGKTQADFGRFRSVFLEDGYIVVHTRNGGGNREDYEDVLMKCQNIHGTHMMQTMILTALTPTSTSRFQRTTRTFWPSSNSMKVPILRINGLHCLP